MDIGLVLVTEAVVVNRHGQTLGGHCCSRARNLDGDPTRQSLEGLLCSYIVPCRIFYPDTLIGCHPPDCEGPL